MKRLLCWTYRADELEPVKSLFGRPLNMLWLVDAVELAIRERSLNPLRMYLSLKRRVR
jgi:hypothetical protein